MTPSVSGRPMGETAFMCRGLRVAKGVDAKQSGSSCTEVHC